MDILYPAIAVSKFRINPSFYLTQNALSLDKLRTLSFGNELMAGSGYVLTVSYMGLSWGHFVLTVL